MYFSHIEELYTVNDTTTATDRVSIVRPRQAVKCAKYQLSCQQST